MSGLELTFDLDDFNKAGAFYGVTADQLPFALSVGLNEAAAVVKEKEEQALVRSLDRPTPFTKRAIGKTFAQKRNLKVKVFVKDIQAQYLQYQIEGGIRTPLRKKIAVPGKRIKLNQYGNLPRGALKRAISKKSTFIGSLNGKQGGTGLWQRKRKGVKLLAVLTNQAQYKKRYDFYGVFEREMTKALPEKIVVGFDKAMKAAKRKTR